MLVKFFIIIVLGLLGIIFTVTVSPDRIGAVLSITETTTIEKVVDEKISGGSVKETNFSQLKSATSAPKISTPEPPVEKIVTKVPEKTHTKDSPKNISFVVATTTVSSAISSSLESSAYVLTPNPVNFSSVNESARQALVNIICTSSSGGFFKPLSASGVIIDPRGVILTNAHVAQYLLLNRYHGREFLNCVARVGSPAVPAYTLSLLYISPAWVRENYKSITSQRPMGTGENDFALLTIASSTNPEISLPKTFPFLPLDASEEDIDTGKQVLIAGYPAGFLGGIAIQRDLYAVSSIVSIGQLFTFRDGALDIFSLGGSPVAQRGSSGGGAIGESGKLLGIIVTSTDAEETDLRDLDAISVAHVGRSLFAETGFSLDSLLASDLDIFGERFRSDTLPALAKLLSDELDSANR